MMLVRRGVIESFAARVHAMPTVATATRRELQFYTIDEVLAEVARIEEAEQAGTLQCLGNWSPGQIFGHLAAWIDYAYEGYPMRSPPWLVRYVIARRLRRVLRRGMPTGVRIPAVAGGTYGTELYSTPEGAMRLRRALSRLQSGEEPRYDHPVLGPVSYEDHVQLNLRHAELHLSFLRY